MFTVSGKDVGTVTGAKLKRDESGGSDHGWKPYHVSSYCIA